MKSKNFFLIFIFGLFIFLLPSFAKALCEISCYDNSFDCRFHNWTYGYPSSERLGIIGSIDWGTGEPVSFCGDAGGKCQFPGFPNGYDGQSCTAKDMCGLFCSEFSANGNWDANQSKCVTCSGAKENRVLGDTGNVYAGCGSETGNPGNGLCESACGANAACDEKSADSYTGGCSTAGTNLKRKDYCNASCVVIDKECSSSCGAGLSCDGKNPGDPCGTGGTCDSNCQCIVPLQACSTACQTAGYYWGTCYSGSTSCSDYFPYITGSTCFYGCSSMTGTDCSGTCLCYNINSNKPPCDPYSSGNTCYYNGSTSCTNSGWTSCVYANSDSNKPSSYYPSGSTCYYGCSVSCTSSGWSRSGCSNCSTGVCCDCLSDGCNHPNNAKCPSGQCKSDCNCEGCAGSLNASASGAGTCTVTASLSASNCSGELWQIRDNGTTKCSGTVSSSPYSYTCNWTVGQGSYTYNLYIGGTFKNGASVICPPVTTYTLSVSKAGTGLGTITSNPAGINCGTGCSSQTASYNSGTSVTLTAAAASGSTFASWSGDCSGAGNCTLTINSNKNVTATFNPIPVGFDFSISINPTSDSVAQGSSISATVNTTLTSGSTQSVSFPPLIYLQEHRPLSTQLAVILLILQ